MAINNASAPVDIRRGLFGGGTWQLAGPDRRTLQVLKARPCRGPHAGSTPHVSRKLARAGYAGGRPSRCWDHRPHPLRKIISLKCGSGRPAGSCAISEPCPGPACEFGPEPPGTFWAGTPRFKACVNCKTHSAVVARWLAQRVSRANVCATAAQASASIHGTHKDRRQT
jgi:hypothetical protein